MAEDFPLKVGIHGIDKISAPLAKVNRKLQGLVGPLMGVSRRLKLAGETAGVMRVATEFGRVGTRIGGVGREVSRLAFRFSALTAVGGAAATKLVSDWARSGDEIAKTARKLGIGVETLQELRFAGSREGIERGALDKGLEMFRRGIGEASIGQGTALGAFSRMGIAVKDAEGKMRGFDDLLDEVTRKLFALEDASQRNAVAAMIFGRSGAEMVKLLSRGPEVIAELRAESRRLGVVMPEEMTTKAERVIDAWTNLKAVLQGIRDVIASPVADAIMPHLESLKEWLIENRERIKDFTENILSKIPNWIRSLGKELKKLHGELKPLLDAGVAFMEWAGPLKTVLIGLGLVLGGPLLVSLTSLAAAFVKLSAVMLATPFGQFVFLAGALAAAGYLLWKNWDKVQEFFEPFFEWIDPKLAALIDKLEALQNLVGPGSAFYSLFGPSEGQSPRATLPAPAPLSPEELEDKRRLIEEIYGVQPRSTSAVEPPRDARVRVSFENLPRGARVRTERNSGVMLDLDVGYNMLEGLA